MRDEGEKENRDSCISYSQVCSLHCNIGCIYRTILGQRYGPKSNGHPLYNYS